MIFLIVAAFLQIINSECTDSLGTNLCIGQALNGGCTGALGNSCQKTCGICQPPPSSCAGYDGCSLNEHVDETAFCFGEVCNPGDNVNCCVVSASCSTFTGCPDRWE